MKHKALTTPDNGDPSIITPAFNAAAVAREIEIKFGVPNLADDGVDHDVFPRIRNYFAALGWPKIIKENTRLLTRQLDTPARDLLQKGSTLRIRGGCEDTNLNHVKIADICLKNGKSIDSSGALNRGEYQTGIHDFRHIDLQPLLDAYPKDQFPEVHDVLAGVAAKDLREFFRIDCIRHRYVLDIPADQIGLQPGKTVAAELLLDDNAFVLDVPKLPYPLVFHHDLEVECEALFKPCEFDQSPDAAKYVTSPLTPAETDKVMGFIRDQIQTAAGNGLVVNTMSKAERGFARLDEALDQLHDVLQASTAIPRKSKVQSAFAISTSGQTANDNKPHYHLDRDFGPILHDRKIAKFER